MKVFYHNDLDGKCAASIIYNYYTKDIPKEAHTARYYPMQYGMNFPMGDVRKNDCIYILDYSIEPEEMRELLEITPYVSWIDHHKTAIEKYETSQHINDIYELTTVDIAGVREVGIAGCKLTYIHLYKCERKIIPKYIRLIGDRDTWAWEYGSDTKDFFNGMLAIENHPTAQVWEDLAKDDNHSVNQGAFLYKIMANGQIVGDYRALNNQEVLRDTGFDVEFHGYKCYAVNGRFDSKPFEALFPDKDIWLTFRYLGQSKCWMVSLYSDKVDVSEIAKQYEYHGKRGGGHTGAAGFECSSPPFLPKETPSALALLLSRWRCCLRRARLSM